MEARIIKPRKEQVQLAKSNQSDVSSSVCRIHVYDFTISLSIVHFPSTFDYTRGLRERWPDACLGALGLSLTNQTLADSQTGWSLSL